VPINTKNYIITVKPGKYWIRNEAPNLKAENVEMYNLVRVTIYSVGGEREYDLMIEW
jgi:hypothetical protein